MSIAIRDARSARPGPPPRTAPAPRSVAALLAAAGEAERSGAWDEALRHYEAAFRRLPREPDSVSAADLLIRIGRVRTERGELEEATEIFGASLAVAELAEDREQEAAALNCLAVTRQLRGDIDEAEGLYERARDLAMALGDDRRRAMIDQNLGTLASVRGDIEAALPHYRAALELFRRLGDDRLAARTLNNIAMAQVDVGDWTAAEASFDRAFELADRARDAAALGYVELNRAELRLKRRAFEAARECCDRAFETFGRLGSNPGLAEAHKFYGVLFRETEKPSLAQVNFSRAATLARECEDPLLEAECEREWAILDLRAERNREALRRLNRAHELFDVLRARRDILDLERRLDRLESTYLEVVRSWAESIEAKDRYTAGHCERVADLTCMLARAVGFEGRDLTWMRMGAFLHDVGKVHVPAEVLNKPGKLDEDEWEVMRNHTVAGDRIVAELNFPWDVRPLVRSHHERWDGEGYPDGLAAEAIPLEARILCLADVYDALTTARSYRPALSHAEALRIMEGDSGRAFDPELFELFRRELEVRRRAGAGSGGGDGPGARGAEAAA